jgi:hypothetical protein
MNNAVHCLSLRHGKGQSPYDIAPECASKALGQQLEFHTKRHPVLGSTERSRFSSIAVSS